METKTKLDITPMLNLVPAVLPEGNERNAIMHNARKVCHQTLLAWEAENGAQFPEYLSYRLTQDLDSLVNWAHKNPSKWNDRVRAFFGEAPEVKLLDWRNRVRILVSFDDVYFDDAVEVLNTEKYDDYRHFRSKNNSATHADAMHYLATTHFHSYTLETSGKRNHILGTHDLRTVFTCECGHSYETRSVNNYSGD